MLVRWNRGADDDAGIQMDEKKKIKKNTALLFCAKQRKNVKRLAVSMISVSGRWKEKTNS